METAQIVVFLVIPLGILWAALLIDLVRRKDIGLGKKLVWGAFTLVTAELGAIVYIALRPIRYPEDGLSPGSENEAATGLLDAAEQGDRTVLAAAKTAALARSDR